MQLSQWVRICQERGFRNVFTIQSKPDPNKELLIIADDEDKPIILAMIEISEEEKKNKNLVTVIDIVVDTLSRVRKQVLQEKKIQEEIAKEEAERIINNAKLH